MTTQAYTPTDAKGSGAYYTPDFVAASLVSWVVRTETDRLLDPSCGDGRFLQWHARSVGIEQEHGAAAAAMQRAPGALIHDGDFFTWAANTAEKFDCISGNPPFIRYQRFKGATRQLARELCARQGAAFSGLSSSWPLFIVGASALLKPSGRVAFVVPAEIGHAPYAIPLLEYLVTHFQKVQIVAVREKIFSSLSEDCWLLFADGFGGNTDTLDFTTLERFGQMPEPPRPSLRLSVSELRDIWGWRLRPFLMPQAGRDLYRSVIEAPGSLRFGDVASIGIGYVSGANDFFHLRPSEVAKWNIPTALLQTSVRNSKSLPTESVNRSVVRKWHRDDAPIYLLHLARDTQIPKSVEKYLDSEKARKAQEAYKCRKRDPWFAVPDVQVPDFFLSYMSGKRVGFARNEAGCTCTNSLHYVRVRDRGAMSQVLAAQKSPFFQLTCEIEGHPLGGGMLKLEPREASRIAIPDKAVLDALPPEMIAEANDAMQCWRHYTM